MLIGYARVSTAEQNPAHQIDALVLQRELIVANTRDGLAAARARGRNGGRRPKLNAAQAAHAQQLYDAGGPTVAQIAALLGVARTTVYGHLNRAVNAPGGAKVHHLGHDDPSGSTGRAPSAAAAHAE